MDSNQRLPPCQGDTLPTELRGQKRNGSISKKSLNSKQILIFRKIPPKFYHLALAEILYKISPRHKIPVEILRKISRFCRSPTRNFIALVRRSRVSPYLIPPRFSRFASPHAVSSARLTLPCLIPPRLPYSALRPLRRPNFFIQL